MSATVTNPWFRKDGPYSSPTYSLDRDPVFEYRGVKVYKTRSGSYLYALNGSAITERAGFTKARAPEVIDEILDGGAPSSDVVVATLRASGFKGLSWSEYSREYAAGRMA